MDVSQMYRTEIWLQELEGKSLQTPIAIPSYKRPNAPIFSKRGFLQHTPELTKDDVFVFIRDTAEQYQAYKTIENSVTLVPLPKYVEEIGLTREYILQWGIQHNYQNIFMFDDRLLTLKVLAPHVTCNNNLILAKCSESTNYKALLLWEHFHKIFPTTVSGVAPWGSCWLPVNINREFAVNNPGASWVYMNINLNDCKQYDLHFYHIQDKGNEDTTFLYFVMSKGLPSRVFSDIAYKEIFPDRVHNQSISGGGAGIYSNLTRKERFLLGTQIFWKNVLNLEFPTKHPGFRILKTERSDGTTFRFNFKRYWAPYYEQHKVR